MHNLKIRENENKGFSLVELIVVIAIMAVLTAVLAPSLLAYVERSRAQKDDSAMGEVTNAIMLAMSDQEVYDEILRYTANDNVSCYVDSTTLSDDDKIFTKAGDTSQYMYGDEFRKGDGESYYAAGIMRGVTITFEPETIAGKKTFKREHAAINKFIRDNNDTTGVLYSSTKKLTNEARSATYYTGSVSYSNVGTLGTMGGTGTDYLFNRICTTITKDIELTSQTYRNSEYTVFIRMGTTGGNSAAGQDAIAVYGQWNGTNLDAPTNVAPPANPPQEAV
jgi:prepilin-type N-terminal cleavage/methylation domain-containing protein